MYIEHFVPLGSEKTGQIIVGYLLPDYILYLILTGVVPQSVLNTY